MNTSEYAIYYDYLKSFIIHQLNDISTPQTRPTIDKFIRDLDTSIRSMLYDLEEDLNSGEIDDSERSIKGIMLEHFDDELSALEDEPFYPQLSFVWENLKKILGQLTLGQWIDNPLFTLSSNALETFDESETIDSSRTALVANFSSTEEAIRHLKDIIMPDLIEKGLTIEGYLPAERVLRDNGYRYFNRSLGRADLKYDDIAEMAGLRKRATRKGIWAFINYNINTGEPLSRTEKIEVAKKYFKEEIYPKTVKSGLIESGSKPTMQDLQNAGYRGFLSALTKGDFLIRYDELFKDSPLVQSKVHRYNWNFLEYDDNGNPLSRLRSIKEAADYVLDTAYPEMIKRGLIDSGDTPNTNKFYQLKANSFIIKLRSLSITLEEVLIQAGFSLSEPKWRFLDIDEDNESLDRNQTIKVAASYFIDKVLPDLVQKGIIDYATRPSKKDILKACHRDFLSAIRRANNKISYTEIIEFINKNYDINFNPKTSKWSWLYFNDSLEPLDYEAKFNKAVEYFKKEVIPSIISEITENIAPSFQELSDRGYSGFLAALTRAGLQYNDIVSKAGLTPNLRNRMQEIGVLLHYILELIFMKHFSRNPSEFLPFFESRVSFYNDEYTLKKPDNSLLILKEGLSIFPVFNLLKGKKEIRMINVDYFLGSSLDTIRLKGVKNYQNKYKILICVPLFLKGKVQTPREIPYYNNLEIFSSTVFVQAMGINSQLSKEFLEKLGLAKSAMSSDGALDELRKESHKSKLVLYTDDYNSSTNELIEKVKERHLEYLLG